LKPIYSNFVKSLNINGNENVMDYGSGPGTISKMIIKKLSIGGHLTCVDISKVWMGIVKGRLKKFNNVDFMLGDISGLKIPEDHYDLIVIHFVLHDIDVDKRTEKIGILKQKLKKGGRIHIEEPYNDKHGMPYEEIKNIMKNNGLKEINALTYRSIIKGNSFRGIYEK
jgi:ubiquinone/menaquinone biosynthesis C-methylase UbiE